MDLHVNIPGADIAINTSPGFAVIVCIIVAAVTVYLIRRSA